MALSFQYNAPSFSSISSNLPDFPSSFGFPSAAVLSDRQQVAMAIAKETKGNDSFWDKVKGGFGGAFSFIFHNISRPWWAVTSAVDAATDQGGFDVSDFFGGFDEGFKGEKQLGWGELLDKWGVLQNHNFLRGLAGFGLDVVSDPLTYAFGIGALSKTSRATTAITSKLLKVGEVPLKDAGEVISAAKEAMKLGDEWSATKTLASDILSNPSKIARESLDPISDSGIVDHFSLLKSQAEDEVITNLPRAAQLRFGVPFTASRLSVPLTPAFIGEKRIAPLTPSLARTAAGEGIIAKAPFASRSAGVIGRTFVPGFENPEFHRMMMTSLHVAERKVDNLSKAAIEAFRTELGVSGVSHLGRKGLDRKQMDEALEWAQKNDNSLIKRVDAEDDPMGYNLEIDEQVLNSAHNLTLNQKRFIGAWHRITEIARVSDGTAGIKYVPHFKGEAGGLYVPHVYQKNSLSLSDDFSKRNATAFSKAGFSKDRVLKMTIGEIAKLRDTSLGKIIETDPMTLLAIRLRRSGVKQSDNIFAETAAKVFGEPLRVVDDMQVAESSQAALKARGDVTGLQERLGSLTGIEKYELAQALKGTVPKKLLDKKASLEEQIQVERFNAPKVKALKRDLTRVTKQIALHQSNKLTGVEKRIKTTRAPIRKNLQVANKELSKAEKALGKAKHGKSNPEIGRNLVVRELGDGTEIAIPARLDYAVKKMKDIATDDELYTRFGSHYNKWLGRWKIAVTTINPGYRMRNTLSDFWNMWLTGIPMSAIPVFGAKALYTMIKYKKGDVDAVRTIQNALDQGVMSGLFTGDVQTITQMLNHFGNKKALLNNKKYIALTAKIATDMNRNAENWGRLTHYLYRTDFEKLSSTEAARWVRMAHFDYEDLTDVERRLFKRIAPFYTWTRKNLPLQIRMLAVRPGRFAAFPKFAFEMEAAAGGEERDIIPDWLSDNMAIAFPGGQGLYYVPQIGAADLNKLMHPEQFAGMITPFFKIPAELIMGKDMFTGADIRGGSHERVPISNPAAGFLKAVGLGDMANVGPTKRGIGEGQFAGGAGASPYVGWLARMTPWTNFFVNQMSDIKKSQRGEVGGVPASVLSQFAGLSFWQVNRDQELYFQGLDVQDKTDKAMRKLRDEGILPEAELQSQSPFEAQLQQVLGLNLSRGGG